MLEGEPTAEGRDGDSWVVTSMGFAPRNGERRFVATFEVPPDLDELEILPSARALGTIYDVNGERFIDAAPHVVSLEPPGGVPSTRARALLAGLGLLLALATGVAGGLLVRRGQLRPRVPRWLVEPPTNQRISV